MNAPLSSGGDMAHSDDSAEPGTVVWLPEPGATSLMRGFREWLISQGYVSAGNYDELWQWSVDHVEDFWSSIWRYFDVQAAAEPYTILPSTQMPGAQWFPGAELNWAQHALRSGADADMAIIEVCEPGGPETRETTWHELRRQVAALASTFRGLGVAPGDRVAAYVPNTTEAVVGFLAAAAVGATWVSCGQDYSAAGAISRLGQLDPSVLLVADGYRYGGKSRDRRTAIAELRAALPTLEATIIYYRLDREPVPDSIDWADATAGDHELACDQVPFSHPLWVLFSSGTTGRPKGIMHGHGGVLLDNFKTLALHLNIRAGDRFCWYTSPSWLMWNTLVAGLVVGATIVCYDGSPSYPGPDALWDIAARHRVSVLGTSPAYLQSCEREDTHPARDHDLSALRVLGVTGSVLPPAAYFWAQREVGGTVQVASVTGGTDVVTALAGSSPDMPVWAGELSVRCLGVDLQAWDASGHAVRDEVGELVVVTPMPTMPVGFWNDPDGSRYRGAYFEMFPGTWRHGDWITLTSRGSVIVHGRSDATLNRNGVRMGSADIYAAVEHLPEIAEALVLGVELSDGRYWMPLFVALTGVGTLDDGLRGKIRDAIRSGASPRHVPDDIFAVRGIPHTRTGKKLEVPVKRIFQGAVPSEVVDPQSVDDFDLIGDFVAVADARSGFLTATNQPSRAASAEAPIQGSR